MTSALPLGDGWAGRGGEEPQSVTDGAWRPARSVYSENIRTITPPDFSSLCHRACRRPRTAGRSNALGHRLLPRKRSKGPNLPPSPAEGHSNLHDTFCASLRSSGSLRGAGSGHPLTPHIGSAAILPP